MVLISSFVAFLAVSLSVSASPLQAKRGSASLGQLEIDLETLTTNINAADSAALAFQSQGANAFNAYISAVNSVSSAINQVTIAASSVGAVAQSDQDCLLNSAQDMGNAFVKFLTDLGSVQPTISSIGVGSTVQNELLNLSENVSEMLGEVLSKATAGSEIAKADTIQDNVEDAFAAAFNKFS